MVNLTSLKREMVSLQPCEDCDGPTCRACYGLGTIYMTGVSGVDEAAGDRLTRAEIAALGFNRDRLGNATCAPIGRILTATVIAVAVIVVCTAGIGGAF